MSDIPMGQLVGGVEPEFTFVTLPYFPKLTEGQQASLAGTIKDAEKRLHDEIFRVSAELNESGSRTSPELLAERIREVRRRKEVLADITGLQVAIGATGKS